MAFLNELYMEPKINNDDKLEVFFRPNQQSIQKITYLKTPCPKCNISQFMPLINDGGYLLWCQTSSRFRSRQAHACSQGRCCT